MQGTPPPTVAQSCWRHINDALRYRDLVIESVYNEEDLESVLNEEKPEPRHNEETPEFSSLDKAPPSAAC